MPKPSPVPEYSFLGACQASGAFTDCYWVTVPGTISLSELVEAFYTTRLFKIERWLLARALGVSSTDSQARQLARGESRRFSAWEVECRSDTEILLRVGRTRSWLSVLSTATTPSSTILYFGSAVVPGRPGGRFGLVFHALGGFHRLYSKLLLASAAKQIAKVRHAA
ncbi:hypothetical protein ACSX1C_00135 [Pseudomonas sp. MBLB4123]|uniref:hypothetical protein n=1 Tax=Pseudomonas sp. MBLB4123 TaxID=3451557 RepID=UPI003F74F829